MAATVWERAVEVVGRKRDVIKARSVQIPVDAELERCVVWEGANVPAGAKQRDGVFGVRGFYAASPAADVELGPAPAGASRGAA